MDTVSDRRWTTESFLAWEDKQEVKHEFDGRGVIPMFGGSLAHQDIVFNLRTLLGRLLSGTSYRAAHEMRLRIGNRIRYPDVIVFAEPVEQMTCTLNDAVAIFEVLSDDTATNDRVVKLIDYANVPASRCYVLLEQTAVAATLFQRETGGVWIASGHTGGELVLPGVNVVMPLVDVYRGPTFAEASQAVQPVAINE